jgi:hypothetical protein
MTDGAVPAHEVKSKRLEIMDHSALEDHWQEMFRGSFGPNAPAAILMTGIGRGRLAAVSSQCLKILSAWANEN